MTTGPARSICFANLIWEKKGIKISTDRVIVPINVQYSPTKTYCMLKWSPGIKEAINVNTTVYQFLYLLSVILLDSKVKFLFWLHLYIDSFPGHINKETYLSPRDKMNKMACAPAKTQISLGIRPVWSESSLSALRKSGSLATHWAHSEDSDQSGRMPRLICPRWAHMPFCWFCREAALFHNSTSILLQQSVPWIYPIWCHNPESMFHFHCKEFAGTVSGSITIKLTTIIRDGWMS